MPCRRYIAPYHGPATTTHAPAAHIQRRHQRRKYHANGTASATGTNAFPSTAIPRHAPTIPNRSPTLRKSGSSRSNGNASNTASEKKTAMGKSVKQKLL